MKIPITTYESIGMNNSEHFRSETAIEFANELLQLKIETNEILDLASLNWKTETSEIREELDTILNQMEIAQAKDRRNIDYIATTLILKLKKGIEVEKCLSRLKELNQLDGESNLNDFFLLYWAKLSWERNDENKNCYLENYHPTTESKTINQICNNWLKENSVEQAVEEMIKLNPNQVTNENEMLDNNFFERLRKYEISFTEDSKSNAKLISISKCSKKINEIIQNKWLNRTMIKEAIEVLNETINENKYFSTSWKDYILHIRHLAFIYGMEYKWNEELELIKYTKAYA